VVIPQIIDGVPTPQVFFLGKALTEIFYVLKEKNSLVV
jgi:hypothetical protein